MLSSSTLPSGATTEKGNRRYGNTCSAAADEFFRRLDFLVFFALPSTPPETYPSPSLETGIIMVPFAVVTASPITVLASAVWRNARKSFSKAFFQIHFEFLTFPFDIFFIFWLLICFFFLQPLLLSRHGGPFAHRGLRQIRNMQKSVLPRHRAEIPHARIRQIFISAAVSDDEKSAFISTVFLFTQLCEFAQEFENVGCELRHGAAEPERISCGVVGGNVGFYIYRIGRMCRANSPTILIAVCLMP